MANKKTPIDKASPEAFAAALDQVVVDGDVRDALDDNPDAALAEMGLEQPGGLAIRTSVKAGFEFGRPIPAYAPPYVPVGPVVGGKLKR